MREGRERNNKKVSKERQKILRIMREEIQKERGIIWEKGDTEKGKRRKK